MTQLQKLVVTAMFIAVAVVVNVISIDVTTFLRIGFVFLPIMLAAIYLGPVAAAIVAACADVLGWVIIKSSGGPLLVGLTVSMALGGLIYGLILYKRPVNAFRLIIARVLVVFLLEIPLNTYFILALSNKGYRELLIARGTESLIALPIEIIMVVTVATLLQQAVVRMPFLNRKPYTDIKYKQD